MKKNTFTRQNNPLVCVVAYDGLCTFEFGISVELFGLPRPEFEQWPNETLFIVYCAGPHCNGANKAAIKLATLGRPVKEMIGGVTGWIDEGFGLDTGR